MNKKIILIIILTILLALGAYYFFFLKQSAPVELVDPEGTKAPSFNTLGREGVGVKEETKNEKINTDINEIVNQKIESLPTLRHLSLIPIGGFSASSTASTTVIRYVDRGVGHILEVKSDEAIEKKISNTTIPRVYESYWNKNLNASIFRYIKDETGDIVNFYGEIRPIKKDTATSTSNINEIENEIKGKFLSSNINGIAISPKQDKIFTYNIENNRGIGYISGFDESKKTKVLDFPLTQVSIEWPEENTVAITTKASALSSGFLYFLNIKSGAQKKVLGNVVGLTTKVSRDARKILFSSSGKDGMTSSIFDTKTNSTQESVFRTITDKCVWSKKYVNELYCAVPTEFPVGIYPDDWYKGNVSFVDQIWHLDTTTGEVHLLANLLNLADELIDATNLSLDPNENFLYFVNKRDLTLWSLDLNN
ncbi:MAG TPA: hypothetical protein VJC02_01760 [Candidatus Paceibacterota bacterium]